MIKPTNNEVSPRIPQRNIIGPNVPSPTVSNEISIWEAVQKLKLQWVVVIALVGYIVYDKRDDYNPPMPAPQPTPVFPIDNTLRSLVSPAGADELGSLYHSLAFYLESDKHPVQGQREEPVIKTIGDFDKLHADAMIGFQRSQNIVGISAINEPINKKLKVATGTLDPAVRIDDPSTNVRESLIATCKDIANEFDPDLKNIPLRPYK